MDKCWSTNHLSLSTPVCDFHVSTVERKPLCFCVLAVETNPRQVGYLAMKTLFCYHGYNDKHQQLKHASQWQNCQVSGVPT